MRRTKADIDSIKLSIYDLCDRYQPMTVRQLFYQLTTIGAIDKTEAEYKGTVCRLTKEMRLNGELPWDWWQTTPVGCTSHAPLELPRVPIVFHSWVNGSWDVVEKSASVSA